MDNTDPESAQLIWKLHRELNGLTRSSRRGNTEFMALDNPLPRRENRPAGGKTKAKPTTSQQQPEPKRKKASQLEDADANTASKPAKSTLTADEPSCKAPPTANNPALPTGQKSRFHPNGASLQNQQQDSLNRDCPTSTKPAPTAAVTTEATPIVTAALAAGQMVRERAQRAGANSTGGHRQIKCFYAGVRWGLALKPSDIQSRAELATALNDALAGEILSCGKGDNLHIVFLDNAGSICEFPSLRSSGSSAKESMQKWQAAVSNAVKVYVRRV